MGPSGCGKTTLLDVLARRIDASRKGRTLEGDVNIRSKRVRYVQQEESLVGVLTARETLVFAARLAGAPLETAEALLDEMGLASAADTQVGTIFSKGMSGGQKRRLSIAVELVSDPCLLFLDEPTSGTGGELRVLMREGLMSLLLESLLVALDLHLVLGLDSASALHVIQHMKTIAHARGVCIIATLHQPSHDAWKLLDVCGFLSKGRCVYFGDPHELLVKFLADSGNEIPDHANIPDFVLSIINSDFAAMGMTAVADLDAMVKSFTTLRGQEESAGTLNMKRISNISQIAEDTGFCKRFCDGADDNEVAQASFYTRFMALCGRNIKELMRDPGILGVRIFM